MVFDGELKFELKTPASCSNITEINDWCYRWLFREFLQKSDLPILWALKAMYIYGLQSVFCGF